MKYLILLILPIISYADNRIIINDSSKLAQPPLTSFIKPDKKNVYTIPENSSCFINSDSIKIADIELLTIKCQYIDNNIYKANEHK